MKKRHFLLLCLSVISFVYSQDKKITQEEIWNGTFETKGMDALRSMNDGKHYTILSIDKEKNESSIGKYAYASLQKTEILLVSSPAKGIPFFTSYSFNEDETKLLLATEVVPIYRRSRIAIYYIYDLSSGSLTKISDNKIMEPLLSPKGDKVAYVFDNNLYIKELPSGAIRQVTKDGVRNAVINGVTDWVYEEEFGFVRAFAWNSDGSFLAFLRFDEREVPEFSMDVYGRDLYPSPYKFKYPKAGEPNALVSLKLYNVAAGSVTEVPLEDAYYIPRIRWKNNPSQLAVQTLNHLQNHLKIYTVNADSNEVTLLLQEQDAAYVDITDNLTFLADDGFIWTSEQDGYNHIYLYDADGALKKQLTRGAWEVTAYYGYDAKNKKIYYQSTENGSINRDVYSVGINGKSKKRLTPRTGTNSASFSTNFIYFINTFSDTSTPYEYSLHLSENGEKVKAILDNAALKEKLAGYEMSPKEFSSIAVNGNELNMWMVKPSNFDPAKKYPLLLFQYSGPGSQQVANSWGSSNDYWHQLLASEGYIVACVDGRGTGLKGRDFKKVTYKELGKYEVEDQIAVAEKLSALPYIDEGRTGIWGWSYGGFMASNCILKGNDTFEMAIAVAPVTSWRFYDTVYTERYMRTPQENARGYDDNSPLTYANQLKGKFLLVHGTGDDNVHVQNSMRMIEALVQANKQFDWAIYPDKNHGIRGGNTRLQLFTKMTDFIKNNL